MEKSKNITSQGGEQKLPDGEQARAKYAMDVGETVAKATPEVEPTLVYERGHLVGVEKIAKNPAKEAKADDEKYQKLQEQMRQIAKKLELPDSRLPSVETEVSKLDVPELADDSYEQAAPPDMPPPLPLPVEQLRELVTAPERAATPELVLERVEQAAEENIPLEGLYERRQEVKDDPNSFTPASSFSPVSSLREGMVAVTSLPAAVVPKVAAAPTKLRDLWKSQPPMYQQAISAAVAAAVVFGVITGVMLIIL